MLTVTRVSADANSSRGVSSGVRGFVPPRNGGRSLAPEFQRRKNGHVPGDGEPGSEVPVAGHTATFSSADLGMKTEKAEKITRRYEGGSTRAPR